MLFLNRLAALTAVSCVPAFIHAQGITLDTNSPDSIKSAASTVAHQLVTYYNGNQTGQIPGYLPQPYFWWEAGAMFGQLINYWYYTGDSSYNDLITQALLFQTGPNNDYMPPNQTKDEGNDDQVFWAFAAMTAAETKFPNPPDDKPQWLALAQAVFNLQTTRWDNQTCGGGLHWQIFTFNAGYDYKNTISNGGYFQLAARLARYTGNATYADWANTMYNWITSSPIVVQNGDAMNVFDGTSVNNQCADADKSQWSYNYATLIAGCAYMYNYTNGSQQWEDRLNQYLTGALNTFFPTQYSSDGNVMVEISCEPQQSCNVDQPSFKSWLAQWLAVTMQLAPTVASKIQPKLAASANGAAGQCSGPKNVCGRHWYSTTYDGQQGVGEQMSALAVIQANLMPQSPAFVSATTGGISKGDPNAGTSGNLAAENPTYKRPITTGDRVGAVFITLALVFGTAGGGWWVVAGK